MTELLEKIPPLGGIFDTHAHYDDERFIGLREELLEGLFALGLEGIITCGCDIPSSKNALKIAEAYDKVFAAVGFHPECLPENAEEISENLAKLRVLLSHKKAVALGEIGLDYHWNTPRDLQQLYFEAQLKLANDLEKPVIIHDREAHGDTLETLKKHSVRGVLHCFSGSVEMAKEVLKMGLYIGVGGVVTFKNARKTKEVVEILPHDRLLLETDCPYLAPEPFRGKTCHSGHIAFTAEKIAEIWSTTPEYVREISLENARRLFNI